jgi:hypothetical protein
LSIGSGGTLVAASCLPVAFFGEGDFTLASVSAAWVFGFDALLGGMAGSFAAPFLAPADLALAPLDFESAASSRSVVRSPSGSEV